MILDVLRVAAFGLAVLFLHDVWRLIRKSITAIDRDQELLDQINEPVIIPITRHHPELAEDDGLVVHGEFDIDLDDDEQTAVLKFIDQFRAAKEQHDRNS